MTIEEYLQEQFPSLELIPSIYNQWDIGIHFSLGKSSYLLKENDEMNLEGFQVIYKQTSQISNELFDQND